MKRAAHRAYHAGGNVGYSSASVRYLEKIEIQIFPNSSRVHRWFYKAGVGFLLSLFIIPKKK